MPETWKSRFTFCLILLSIYSQFSGPLASLSLIPFVVYLSVDSHQYCLISGCITSHPDYYFLTTHSFYNLIPVYPHFIYIGNLNWIMSLRFSEIFMDSVPAWEKANSRAWQASLHTAFPVSWCTLCAFCPHWPPWNVLCLEKPSFNPPVHLSLSPLSFSLRVTSSISPFWISQMHLDVPFLMFSLFFGHTSLHRLTH